MLLRWRHFMLLLGAVNQLGGVKIQARGVARRSRKAVTGLMLWRHHAPTNEPSGIFASPPWAERIRHRSCGWPQADAGGPSAALPVSSSCRQAVCSTGSGPSPARRLSAWRASNTMRHVVRGAKDVPQAQLPGDPVSHIHGTPLIACSWFAARRTMHRWPRTTTMRVPVPNGARMAKIRGIRFEMDHEAK